MTDTYALTDEQKMDELLDANSLADMEPSLMIAYMCGMESSDLFKPV